MRGASALQQVLDENRAHSVFVQVVWEPVILTDLGPPLTSTLALIGDSRAAQYWDEERVLSAEMLRAILADPARYGALSDLDEETIVWDFVAMFAPGVRWDADLPVPEFHGFPVVESLDGLRAALTKLAPSDAAGL